MAEINDPDFTLTYNEKSLWAKIKSQAVKAGRKLIELVLVLFYCLGDEDTPGWAKATIVGALLYFVSPIDAIPDFLPGGYVDDMAVLVAAAGMVAAHIKSEHRERAREWVEQTFGPADYDGAE